MDRTLALFRRSVALSGLLLSLAAPLAIAQESAPNSPSATAPGKQKHSKPAPAALTNAAPAAPGVPEAKPVEVQDPSLPSGADVIKSYVAALGGEQAIRAHTSRHMKGTMERIQQNEISELQEYMIAPNKKLLKVVKAANTLQGGYDGTHVWAWDASKTPQVFPQPDFDSGPNFDFYRELNYANWYPKMETITKETFDGRECFRVKLTSKSGKETYEYFDVKTGLKAGEERIEMGQRRNMIRLMDVWSDWKDFGGVKVAMRITSTLPPKDSKNPGQVSQIISYETVEFDALDPKIFELPKEVQDAAEAQAKLDAAPPVTVPAPEAKKDGGAGK